MNRFWLNAAFYQASLADGNSGKNPAVGCVLVKNDQIIGVGHTSKGGRPHAEENALKMAGKDAKGANMYLTLEPCCLDDNLNSCTRQIIRAGVKKVFIGMIDYNKLTKRKSFQYLLNHGVQVELIFLDFENFLLNYSQYCVHVLNRPQITIKLASSADSKITYANGESKWITSKLSRSHVHQIRSNHDGILVGSKTSKIDDPSLTVRVPGYKKNIHRLVLDTNLNININSNLTKNLSKNPLVIFTSENT
ncbi:MAG: bifunctional diaminohydroxyphosphoribosylaminopyrimidine deaminase/5-amino-6-(5-phosphoribosylamino)uracil reductase RibD, partial [Pseudomonadota bacterium]|nr:bifunctional diaminohydroxyphosphoribosylaminopyrimidine deaminase/5-amino-6-(5-phosphoribosylamino)uracil reductase RibD [Pseudomonadota bacterium]